MPLNSINRIAKKIKVPFAPKMRPGERKVYPWIEVPMEIQGCKNIQKTQQKIEVVKEKGRKYYLELHAGGGQKFKNNLDSCKVKSEMNDVYFYPKHLYKYILRFRKKIEKKEPILEIILTKSIKKRGLEYVRYHAILFFKIKNRKALKDLFKAMEHRAKDNLVSPFFPYLLLLKKDNQKMFKKLVKIFPCFEEEDHPGAKNMIAIQKDRYLFFGNKKRTSNILIEIDKLKEIHSRSETKRLKSDYKFLDDIFLMEIESGVKGKINKKKLKQILKKTGLSIGVDKELKSIKAMRSANQTVQMAVRVTKGGPTFV